MNWLDTINMATMFAAMALKGSGHSVVATEEEPGMLRCDWCDVSLQMLGMSYADAIEAFRTTASLRERCPGELYRPIPGTPWFEYGPAKERA